MTQAIPLTVETTYLRACTFCNGVGYTYHFELEDGPFQAPSRRGDKWLDLDGESGWYHGHIVEIPCPNCKQYAAQERLQKFSGLSEDEIRELRLSKFTTMGQLAEKQKAKDSIALFAGQGKNANGFVTLFGDYGVGKTFLAKAMINELIINGCQAKYITASDMLADIRKNFDSGNNKTLAIENAIHRYQSISALVIDEFDKVNPTDWVKESIHRLLNVRYENRKHLLTVLITNTNPKLLPVELGYLQSRMFAGTTIFVPGPDVRVTIGKMERKVHGS